MRTPLYRSPAYLRYVAGHDSCVAWEECAPPRYHLSSQPSVAHHVRMGGNGGMGVKPSDYRTVPLTDLEHRALHQMGEKEYWRRVGVDPDLVIISLLVAYCGINPEDYSPPKIKGDLREAIASLELLAELVPSKKVIWF